MTVRDLVNHFLDTLDGMVRNGELTARTFYVYKNTRTTLVDYFGRVRR